MGEPINGFSSYSVGGFLIFYQVFMRLDNFNLFFADFPPTPLFFHCCPVILIRRPHRLKYLEAHSRWVKFDFFLKKNFNLEN